LHASIPFLLELVGAISGCWVAALLVIPKHFPLLVGKVKFEDDTNPQ